MALEIVAQVRQALSSGQPLRQSDILALLAVTDQLWQASVQRSMASADGQHRRDYMREYMRRYRAGKRASAA
jgi:hypothetical protein